MSHSFWYLFDGVCRAVQSMARREEEVVEEEEGMFSWVVTEHGINK